MKRTYLSSEVEILDVDRVDVLTASFDVLSSGNLDSNNPDEVQF